VRGTGPLIAACGVALLALTAAPATAEEIPFPPEVRKQRRSLPLDDGATPAGDLLDAFIMNLGSGRTVKVDVFVISGSAVDVYLTDIDDYRDAYTGASNYLVFYKRPYSQEMTTAHKFDTEGIESRNLAVLVENCDCFSGGARGTSNVTYEITIEFGALPSNTYAVYSFDWPVFCIGSSIPALIFSVWLVHHYRKKKKVAAEDVRPPLFCPRCGGGMRFIADYGRHYCENCRTYAPAPAPAQALWGRVRSQK
jgi:hypothetical protein